MKNCGILELCDGLRLMTSKESQERVFPNFCRKGAPRYEYVGDIGIIFWKGYIQLTERRVLYLNFALSP